MSHVWRGDDLVACANACAGFDPIDCAEHRFDRDERIFHVREMASDAKKLKALADFEISYPHPITFEIGEELETHHRDDVWTGWIWVKTRDGNTGWAPESYMKRIDGSKAVAIRDYTARELSMKKGDLLEPSFEIGGWLWCRNQRDEEGWAPAFNLRPVSD